MNELPGELLYTKDHEWLRPEDDGSYVVGITEYAQAALGDLVYVELPDVGQELDENDEMAVVESVKAASDVYAPIAGTVVAVNEALADDPESINNDPYGDGWIVRMTAADGANIDDLMNPAAYQEFLDELEA
jgi:glycine cleavage system H protein